MWIIAFRRSWRLWRVQGRFAAFKAPAARSRFKAALRRSRRLWRVQGSRALRGVQGAFGAFKVHRCFKLPKAEERENFKFQTNSKKNQIPNKFQYSKKKQKL
jgi:hypothetical protein